MSAPDPQPRFRRTLSSMIFLSRWLQAPLYFGLIIAQGAYVWHFMVELFHLLHEVPGITEEKIMLSVLGLIDVVMIANLLIMVIIGGYETFVSRLELKGHPDQPEWLSHVNAGILKVKLAMALIGISSIHLLKSFIAVGTESTAMSNAIKTQVMNPEQVQLTLDMSRHSLVWQVVIHATFLFSALALAWIDRLTVAHVPEKKGGNAEAH